MKNVICTTLFHLLILSSLFAEEECSVDNIDLVIREAYQVVTQQTTQTGQEAFAYSILAEFEGTPSSMVNQCVNAVTGTFCDFQTDLVIPGAEPLYIQRSHVSSDAFSNMAYPGQLMHTWHLNHGGIVYGEAKEGFVHLEEGGPITSYEYNKKDKLRLKLSKHDIKNGLTNCSTGIIGGHTNLKNNAIHVEDDPGKLTLRLGSGGSREFKRYPNDKRKFNLLFDLKPNGNQFRYDYNAGIRLRQINCLNRQQKILSYAILDYDNFAVNPRMILYSSDNRQVHYQFVRKDTKFFLTRVDCSHAPYEAYTYKEGDINQICRKDKPGGRFLEIDYYTLGLNTVDGIFVDTSSRLNLNDYIVHRVKHLKEPVGHDTAPIVTHTFFYGRDYNKNIGATEVYDAYKNLTTYFYTASNRLRGIKKFRGDTPYTVENFIWGTPGKNDEGNLVSRHFADGNGRLLMTRYLQYDAHGNVGFEQLFGNLTGRNTQPIILDKKAIPQKNGCEFFEKAFHHSNDGYNLLLCESTGRQKTHYRYEPNSDRLSAKVITPGNESKMVQRQFFEYDENASIIKEITDDGFSWDRNDLIGVTERHIKEIIPTTTTPIGLPAVVMEKCLDLSSGKPREVLLKKIVNAYTLDGKLIKQDHYDANDAYVFSLSWKHDAHGNVIEEVDALGQVKTYEYDVNDNLVKEQGPNETYHKEFVYDFMDRLITEKIVYKKNGPCFTTSHRYNYLNQRIATVDIYGNETQFSYDHLGRLIETSLPAIPDENGHLIHPIEKQAYDELGNVISKTDPRGFCTTMAHTIRGKPYLINYPDGSSEKFEYTIDGYLEKSIAKNSVVTTHILDYQGRSIGKNMLGPNGEVLSSTTAVYNAFHLLSETDPAGHITYYTYDFAGRLKTATKGEAKTAYFYDNLGRLTKTCEYFGDGDNDYTAKVQKYDLLNRVIEERMEDAAGHVLRKIEFGYDENGNCNLVKTRNEAGVGITTTTYNALGEVEEVIDSKGNLTKTVFNYSYRNAYGQCVPCQEITDPLGNIIQAISDTSGKIAQITHKNPFGQLTQKREFTYDLSGNRVRAIETVFTPNATEREVVTLWEYDSANRMISCYEAMGTPEQKRMRFTYNIYGQKESLIKPDGVKLQHAYDRLGRMIEFKASDNSFCYQYTYDLNSNLIKAADLKNQTETFKAYDSNDRLISETLANGLAIKYAYDRQGRPLRITLPDQSAVGYEYAAAFLSKAERYSSSGQLSYAHCYQEFDLAGNPLSAKMIKSAGTTEFHYDILNRIRQIQSPYWSETIPEDGYDPVGNLVKRQIKDNLSKVPCQYTYDDLYQVKQEEGMASHSYIYDSMYNRVSKDGNPHQVNALNQLLHDTKSQYEYDLNGNLVKKKRNSDEVQYDYDALDRLICVTFGNQQVRYIYDEVNRRLSQESYQNDGQGWQMQTTLRYLYFGQNEVGAVDSTGNLVEFRLLGLGKGAEIGAAVAIELKGNVYAPVHDHNGNVTCLIDARTGNLFETYRYSAFGEEQLFDAKGYKIEKTLNPWRFASKRYDAETGFVYFGRRYYNAEAGRWATADPLGYEAGPNLYAYVLNSPLTHFDLYGLWHRGEAPVARPEPTSFKSNLRNNSIQRRHGIQDIGRLIEAIGRHIPIPLVKDVIGIIGHFLNHGRLKGYVMSYREPHSRYGIYYGVSYRDGVSFTNGINTDYEGLEQQTTNVSKAFGDTEVLEICNASHKIFTDLLEISVQKIGISTNSVRQWVKGIREWLAKNPDGRILAIGWSQGGQIIYCGKDYLTEEERARIDVITIGSVKMISKKDFGSAVNYVGDYASICMDTLGVVKGLCGHSDYDVRFRFSSPFSFFNHSFNSPTYQEVLQDRGRQFLQRQRSYY